MWVNNMEPKFIKAGFCSSEMDQIQDLITRGYGKNKSDIVRKATIEFINRYR